jgi:hypothetical protein
MMAKKPQIPTNRPPTAERLQGMEFLVQQLKPAMDRAAVPIIDYYRSGTDTSRHIIRRGILLYSRFTVDPGEKILHGTRLWLLRGGSEAAAPFYYQIIRGRILKDGDSEWSAGCTHPGVVGGGSMNGQGLGSFAFWSAKTAAAAFAPTDLAQGAWLAFERAAADHEDTAGRLRLRKREIGTMMDLGGDNMTTYPGEGRDEAGR